MPSESLQAEGLVWRLAVSNSQRLRLFVAKNIMRKQLLAPGVLDSANLTNLLGKFDAAGSATCR